MARSGYAPSDTSRFYQLLFHSRDWQTAATLGRFQVHVRKGFALNPACR